MTIEEKHALRERLVRRGEKSAAGQRQRLRTALLASVLIFSGLLPIWTVKYVPLYDYQNHLLEAQVVVQYQDPVTGYASHYQIREGWTLRSNALATLTMIALGQFIPMETAGKMLLSLYVILLGSGMACLLACLRKPAWLLLFVPLFTYNFTFTSGLLNWSLGFALSIWGFLLYLRWRETGKGRLLAGLAVLALLIYAAHLLAWGLFLVVVFTLPAAARLPYRRRILLVLAVSSPVPMLLVTRPVLALSPAGIALALWGGAGIVRRLKMQAWQVVTLGAGVAILSLAAVKVFKNPFNQVFPDVGYSAYSKLAALPNSFTLPVYYSAVPPGQAIYNLAVLALIAAIVLLLAAHNITRLSERSYNAFGWWAATGLLAFIYLLIPTRTYDIIFTEPRVLLVGLLTGMLAVQLPLPGTRMRRLLPVALALLAVIPAGMAFYQARLYDAAARNWAGWLAEIPPNRRVLVFSDPLPDEARSAAGPLMVAQVFDQNQFSSTYALEQGGFISNTFFNGPLLPGEPGAIPPYWWSEFDAAQYVERRCERLLPEYDYVLVWNPRTSSLMNAMLECFGSPVSLKPEMGLWRID